MTPPASPSYLAHSIDSSLSISSTFQLPAGTLLRSHPAGGIRRWPTVRSDGGFGLGGGEEDVQHAGEGAAARFHAGPAVRLRWLPHRLEGGSQYGDKQVGFPRLPQHHCPHPPRPVRLLP